MGTLVDTLGRVSGNLIRAEDWNALLAAVESMETALRQEIVTLSNSVDSRFATVNADIAGLRTQVSDLDTELDGLKTTVGTLRSEFDSFKQGINTLLAQYYRVTLRTEFQSYAVGEVAELTAQVTDLQGNPLALTSTNRPWIDFVATWGRFRVVSGFESRSSTNERSMSVRVNTQGVAKVRLHAESVEGVNWDTEDAMADLMRSSVDGTGKNVAKHILDASSPAQAKQAGVFKMITAAYETATGAGIRAYADAYYNKAVVSGGYKGVGAIDLGTWKNYQTTVIAFAKADSDPRTPDQARGASSIQVTFRDWVRAWIEGDYLDDVAVVADGYRGRLEAQITDDYQESLNGLSREIDEIVHGKGILGRERHLKAVNDALDKVNPPRGVEFSKDLTVAVQDAVTVQQAMDATQATRPAAKEESAIFHAVTRSTTKAQAGVAQVKQQVGQVQQSIQAVTNQVSSVQRDVSSLDGRLTASFSESGAFQLLNNRVESMSRQVQVLQGLNVSEVQNKLVTLEGIGNRLASLESAFHTR